MPFQFALERIHRLRRSVERQDQQKLTQTAQKLTQIRLRIADLERNYQQTKRQWRQEVSEANLASILHFGIIVESAYARISHDLLSALQNTEREFAERALQYRESRSQREVLDHLKTRQLAVYHTERQRRTQQTVDELYLSRFRLTSREDLPIE